MCVRTLTHGNYVLLARLEEGTLEIYSHDCMLAVSMRVQELQIGSRSVDLVHRVFLREPRLQYTSEKS